MPRGYLPVLLLGIVTISAACLVLRWRTLSQAELPAAPFLVEQATAAEGRTGAPRADAAPTMLRPPAPAKAGLAPDEGGTRQHDSAAGGETAPVRFAAGRPLELNTATAAQLDTLPGIGPVLAARIVAYRQLHGPFRNVELLQEVEGIGPRKFAELKARVYVAAVH